MLIRKPFLLFAILSTLLPPAAGVASDAWKWTDEHGRVHYGDKPSGEHAVPVEIHKTPRPDPAMEKRREKRERVLEVFSEDRRKRKEEREAAQRKREKSERRCAEARKNLQATLNASYLYEKTGDPENPDILTEEERKAETERIRKQVESWCR